MQMRSTSRAPKSTRMLYVYSGADRSRDAGANGSQVGSRDGTSRPGPPSHRYFYGVFRGRVEARRPAALTSIKEEPAAAILGRTGPFSWSCDLHTLDVGASARRAHWHTAAAVCSSSGPTTALARQASARHVGLL